MGFIIHLDQLLNLIASVCLHVCVRGEEETLHTNVCVHINIDLCNICVSNAYM